MWPHQDTKMSWPSSNSVFLSAEHWLQGGNHSYWSGMLCLLQIPSIVISKHMHSTTSSTNDGLCRLINTLKQQVSADNIADTNTLDQAVSYAALHSAIFSRGGTFEAECSFTSRCVWLLSWKIRTNHATTWYCMWWFWYQKYRNSKLASKPTFIPAGMPLGLPMLCREVWYI